MRRRLGQVSGPLPSELPLFFQLHSQSVDLVGSTVVILIETLVVGVKHA